MRAVGVVGLGNMGAPIAAHVAEAGFELVGYDVLGTTGRLPADASAADSIEEIARRVDTILMSVPDGDASLAVVRQLAETSHRRADVVVDLSTIGPAAAERCAELLVPVAVTYTDGPVSGGVAGARARSITLMFSGPASVFDDHRPLLESFAGAVLHVGDRPGQGQVMKLVNNFLSATALAASSEALAVGRSYGLDLATMIDVVNLSSGQNTATSDKFPRRVLTGTYDTGFLTRLMAKDVRLFNEIAERVPSERLVAPAVGALWAEFEAAMPDSDFSEIWRFVSRDD